MVGPITNCRKPTVSQQRKSWGPGRRWTVVLPDNLPTGAPAPVGKLSGNTTVHQRTGQHDFCC